MEQPQALRRGMEGLSATPMITSAVAKFSIAPGWVSLVGRDDLVVVRQQVLDARQEGKGILAVEQDLHGRTPGAHSTEIMPPST